MSAIVISQPMFFPWVGLFEQIKLADVYVHYDDVQLPVGRSFTNRVQIKTAQGVRWLTAPLRHVGDKVLISEARFDNSVNWRAKHLALLRHAFSKARFRDEALGIAERVYSVDTDSLAEFNIEAIEAIAEYLGIRRTYRRSSTWSLETKSTQRLLDIVLMQGGDRYITGHGAANYLDFELFEKSGVLVEFMDYRRLQYPQLHGVFDPHVSILDLIANCGQPGVSNLCSPTLPWREFLAATGRTR